MKIRHWVVMNQSGMHHLALAVAEGERRLGHDALVLDASDDGPWKDPIHADADVQCVHSRMPPGASAEFERVSGRRPRLVFFSHGIPEHVIELAVQDVNGTDRPDHTDYWAILRYWLRESDAFVVFSPRQAVLFNTMLPRGHAVDLVPLGVDTAFWKTQLPAFDRLRGEPSVWMSENQHRIKWALDILLAWPLVAKALPHIHLHAHYIPYDLHRFFVDLANTNGASSHATITPKYFAHDQLRTLWAGCDFMLATTRYGDPTCLTMQAEASGLKTISYPGNQYASYWISEGDQRVIADQLTGICYGAITPREDKLPVPDLTDMARETLRVYERIAA